MKTGEMEKLFGFTRSTIASWKKDFGSDRNLLYKTLEALPVEFVINIQNSIKEEEKNKHKNNELLGVDK